MQIKYIYKNLFYFESLLGVVYFNHRFGCQKCFTLGVYDKNAHRVCFSKFDANKRTDDSFRRRLQPIHHKELTISSLECLKKTDGSPLLDMIIQFPTSDPLHLLEEGVMKKCINMWMKGKTVNKRKKWSDAIVDRLNKNILQWNRELPSDINRKLRTLNYLSYYKATEFRSILLYLGLVAFKNVLGEQEYAHFLSLCLGIRFLSCNYYVRNAKLKNLARVLLTEYCENFVKIYGKAEVVSNIHNIAHIAYDVDNLGNLNEISTYPFENFLHEIKLRVKPGNNPMEQITRRLIEQSSEKQINFITKKYENVWVPELKYEFRERDTPDPLYKYIRIKPNVILCIKKFGDKFFITKNGDIVEMIYAIKKSNSYFIFGAPIHNKLDFFTKPYSSKNTDIYLSDGKKGQPKLYKDSEIKAKMMCLSYIENYIFIPLLHTYDECLNV